MPTDPPTVSQSAADQLCMPGSWGRSRLGAIDNPYITDPPEPAAPEGFLLPARGLVELRPRTIPNAARNAVNGAYEKFQEKFGRREHPTPPGYFEPLGDFATEDEI